MEMLLYAWQLAFSCIFFYKHLGNHGFTRLCAREFLKHMFPIRSTESCFKVSGKNYMYMRKKKGLDNQSCMSGQGWIKACALGYPQRLLR